MRAFFRRHRGLHIWLLSVCGVLALYFALRTVPGLMNWVSRQVVMPLERAVAAVCYRADFSVAELLYATAAGVVLLWLGAAVRRLITEKGRRGRIVYRFALTAVCTVLTVYAGFSLLWGVNYYAESFQEQSGVYARSPPRRSWPGDGVFRPAAGRLRGPGTAGRKRPLCRKPGGHLCPQHGGVRRDI
ncbi:MAG: DUF3810 family protein [Oscillospiraceae bacterium]